MWYHSFDSLCIENEKLKSRMEVEKDIMLYIAFYYGLKSGWTRVKYLYTLRFSVWGKLR